MTGTKLDFQIYEEQFFAGAFEVLEQNVDAFNAASNGTIRLNLDIMKGDFVQQSFFQEPDNLIQHRDTTNTDDATATKLTQGEYRWAKVNKRIGPVENTIDSFKKIGVSPDVMAFTLGQQAAPRILNSYLNTAVSSLVGAMSVTGVGNSLVLDSSTRNIQHVDLIKGMAKMGDMANRISMWVMHSKPFYDLMEHGVTEKLLEVTAGTLYNGTNATLGKPVLVTDVESLFSEVVESSVSSYDQYWTFGLVNGAVDVVESEDRSMLVEVVGGKNNLIVRYQGEYAYTVGLKGMEYSGSAANPNDSALATASNWTQAAASHKSLMGIGIKTR